MENVPYRVENIEKLLVTSNFSSSHNVFHSYMYISLVRQNAVLCGNGLKKKLKKCEIHTLVIEWNYICIRKIQIFVFFPNNKFLDFSKLKDSADNNFEFDDNGEKLPKRVENNVGKGEIARYEQFLLSSQCFQMTCTADTWKQGLVWERVKFLPHHSEFQCFQKSKFFVRVTKFCDCVFKHKHLSWRIKNMLRNALERRLRHWLTVFAMPPTFPLKFVNNPSKRTQSPSRNSMYKPGVVNPVGRKIILYDR